MNNYNQSSSGENITFKVFYDHDEAQCYFNYFMEYVEKIDLGGRDNYLYLIGDSDKPYYKKSDLNKLSKNAIFELWLNYEFGYNVDISDYKKSEYIADLMQVTILRHYAYLASQYYWHEIQSHIPHEYFVSRGYSQGDAVLVVKIDGLTKEYKQYIDNIFWDCPIYIRAEINGREFYEDDFLNDIYDYDTDQIKANIQKLDISHYAKNWLIDNLPDHPAW